MLVVAPQARACGPFIPDAILDGSDVALLRSPGASFAAELQRMKLGTDQFKAVIHATPAEMIESELRDLRAALRKRQTPKSEIESLCAAHKARREKLQQYLDARDASRRIDPWFESVEEPKPDNTKLPQFPALDAVEGIPAEFMDYFDGAQAWHNPSVFDKAPAREAWERIIKLPAAERRYKSTWAAYMLGRFWDTEDPDKAAEYYRQVRKLAREGFADSAGLAAASLGWEARLALRQSNYLHAIELYLDQLSAGDQTAVTSLRTTVIRALGGGGAALSPLAKNPRTQRVVTAYILSTFPEAEMAWPNEADLVEKYLSSDSGTGNLSTEPDTSLSAIWLAAVEAARISDTDSAEKFALIAYQANHMELAQRWIKQAHGSPVAQWIQAKLLLRAGKSDAAAELLSQISRSFPVEPPGTNTIAPVHLMENLFFRSYGNWDNDTPANRQLLGELGVLRLARREFVQSLDALLNAGFWEDAAYVGERVLTLDELKRYVDSHWPAVSEEEESKERDIYADGAVAPFHLRKEMRHLLARRLTRSFRGGEARDYYPIELRPQCDALMAALADGWNESLPNEQRAKALFAAARITRADGLELMGTEGAPDYNQYRGNHEVGPTVNSRATHAKMRFAIASPEELDRASAHHPDPEQRFHYRYQAAALGWEAAKLMPNNSEETARVLCISGTWLKNRDPETADIFYKSLVRRNRKTAIGMEADRIRWFPKLDENGQVIPLVIPPPAGIDQDMLPEPVPTDGPMPSLDTPPSDPASPDSPKSTDALTAASDSADFSADEGETYVVHQGDSISKIIAALRHLGHPITVMDLIEANPELDPTKLTIGQKLRIPPLRSPALAQ